MAAEMQCKVLPLAIYGALSHNTKVCRKQHDSAPRQEKAQGDVAHLHKDKLVET